MSSCPSNWQTIPDEWPEIDNAKWYYCTVQAYQGGGPPFDCSMNPVGDWSECIIGIVINGWINGNDECIGGLELVTVSGFTAQRLIGVVGPYDDAAACNLAH